MSVAQDLDSLLAPSPLAGPVPRPRLRVVPCAPGPAGWAQPGRESAPAARPARRGQSARPASVAVLHAPSSAALAAPLRLTRRGVAVLVAVTATLGALLVWAAALSAPDPAAGAPAHAAPATITVHAGDTLWAVADRVAPRRDPRAEVAELRSLNHLADPSLTPGQVLRVR